MDKIITEGSNIKIYLQSKFLEFLVRKPLQSDDYGNRKSYWEALNHFKTILMHALQCIMPVQMANAASVLNWRAEIYHMDAASKQLKQL